MRAAIVVFTRDLRVTDNPVLDWACRVAEQVVPVFVHDPRLSEPSGAGPSGAGGSVGEHRRRFLAGSLADLRGALRSRGGDLFELCGDPAEEVACTVTALRAAGVTVIGVGIAADASGYARRRQRRLTELCADLRVPLEVLGGIGIIAPGALRPVTGDHYKVFTPYWRVWSAAPKRPVLPAPDRIAVPEVEGLRSVPGARSRPGTAAVGGEAAGRDRMRRWLGSLDGYVEERDRLAVDATSRLSAYLHFGCVSPVELAELVTRRGAHAAGQAGRAGERAGEAAEAYVRQLCWRDFFQQVLHAFPDLPRRAYRRGARADWANDPETFEAWRDGRTGMPLVDAGMRQLATEGWMPNRVRMVAASYLTKQLGQDWRPGADHFMDLLVDGDVANNYGNWQWVAGTGNDPRPNRRFNPVLQARRHDPTGEYVRLHLPELAHVPGPAVHEPWRLPAEDRAKLDYPLPFL